jgi:putative methionine-R-sulfoxide reductase with GAF domain
MLRVVFEPTVPVFERGKTVHVLDCGATVTGSFTYNNKYSRIEHYINGDI